MHDILKYALWGEDRLLFQFPPEFTHKIVCKVLGLLSRLDLLKRREFFRSIEVDGVHYRNPVGLAAGFDKDGKYLNVWDRLGFGFVEIGSVKLRHEGPNPYPRLMRLVENKSLLNSFGMPSVGVDDVVDNLKNYSGRMNVGVSLVPNRRDVGSGAVSNVLFSMRKVFPYVSFLTINLSCPNILESNNLGSSYMWDFLFREISLERMFLACEHKKECPLYVKVAPDWSEEKYVELSYYIDKYGIDGVVATNSIGVPGSGMIPEWGGKPAGLSGSLIYPLSLATTRLMRRLLPRKTIIGCGGIFGGADAMGLKKSGVELFQIFTSFVYCGPKVIEEIASIC